MNILTDKNTELSVAFLVFRRSAGRFALVKCLESGMWNLKVNTGRRNRSVNQCQTVCHSIAQQERAEPVLKTAALQFRLVCIDVWHHCSLVTFSKQVSRIEHTPKVHKQKPINQLHLLSLGPKTPPVLRRADSGEGKHEVAQQHAQVLVVHALHMLHQAWAPQPLGRPTCIEGTHTGGHEPQALVHRLPHLPQASLVLKAITMVKVTLQVIDAWACTLETRLLDVGT